MRKFSMKPGENGFATARPSSTASASAQYGRKTASTRSRRFRLLSARATALDQAGRANERPRHATQRT
jgi:hypothetical protein